ncbi:hypothetical protein [Pseudomonas orientalis]|nr:hypothetical protein [Pseudomonas orientalis]
MNDTPLYRFDGFWCVPASPYREGALRAVRFALLKACREASA